MTDPAPADLALVGGGPRGLFALESLAARLASGRRCEARIDLYEPRARPGSGPNYDTDQPPFLRMNFAAGKIDAFSRDPTARSGAGEPRALGPTLVDWLGQDHAEWADEHAYVPRARVGAYLEHAYERVAGVLERAGVVLCHRRERVESLEPGPDAGWLLGSRGEPRSGRRPAAHDAPAETRRAYRHVLVVTGHESSRRDSFGRSWRRAPFALVEEVYPVDSLAACAAGSTVALRGFALTAIDAILALTEGRGGRFESSPGADEHELRYVPSSGQVARIVPFARSGLPMRAKLDPRKVSLPQALDDLWQEASEAVQSVRDLDQLRSELARAATSALETVHRAHAPGPSTRTAQAIAAAFGDPVRDQLHDHLHDQLHHPRYETLEHCLAVAVGRAPLDAGWAAAEAWRRTYPAIVERVGHGGLEPEERPAFAALAARMERLAFGPPALQLAKMLALERAGILDLRYRRCPELAICEGRLQLRVPELAEPALADGLVDAVVPAPGCDARSPLLGPLLERGLARRYAGTDALETDRQGRVVDAEGRAWESLSVIGRAVEGCVLGHDTLSRTLHPHLDRWAHRWLEAVRPAPVTA